MTENKPAPAAAQQSVQEQMARLAATYTRTVLQSIAEAQTGLAQLESSNDPAAGIQALFSVFHDMKGQGATFGYPLLSEIGQLGCHALRGQTVLAASLNHAVAQSLTAARMIVEEHVTGQGGQSGRDLMQALQALYARA